MAVSELVGMRADDWLWAKLSVFAGKRSMTFEFIARAPLRKWARAVAQQVHGPLRPQASKPIFISALLNTNEV